MLPMYSPFKYYKKIWKTRQLQYQFFSQKSEKSIVVYQFGRGLNTWLSGVMTAWSFSYTLRVKPGKSTK